MSDPRRSRWPRHLPPLALAAAIAVVVAACGGGDDGVDASSAAPTTPSTSPDLPTLPVLLDDTMVDPQGDWFEGESESGATFFQNGVAYEVEVPAPNSSQRVTPSALRGELLTDTQVTATAEVDDSGGSGPDRVFGVACRVEDPLDGDSGYYEASIGDRFGGYSIVRNAPDGGEDVELASSGDAPPSTVGQEEPVSISLACIGEEGGDTTLVLEVDGRFVVSAVDPDGLPAGEAGLFVRSGDEGAEGLPVFFETVEIRGVSSSSADPDAGSGSDPDSDSQTDSDAGDTGTATSTGAFVDDFSDPDSGWSTIDENGTSSGYEGGEYVVETVGSHVARAPLGALATTGTVSVDVIGDLGTSFAGLCLGTDVENKYEFAIGSDGYASVGSYTDRRFEFLQEGIQPAVVDGRNRVEVRFDRSDAGTPRFSFSVNGEQIYAVEDSTDPVGIEDVSLCSTVGDGDGADTRLSVSYDDFEYSPEG